jgi:hypothetical protein
MYKGPERNMHIRKVRWLLLEGVYVLTFNPSTLPQTLPIQRVLRTLWSLCCRQKVVERGAPFFRAKEDVVLEKESTPSFSVSLVDRLE